MRGLRSRVRCKVAGPRVDRGGRTRHYAEENSMDVIDCARTRSPCAVVSDGRLENRDCIRGEFQRRERRGTRE